MNIIAAGHQPNYLPYPGFFDKMSKCDVFFLLDNAQFVRDDFHHRNRVLSPQGEKWMTIPVNKRKDSINQILIRESDPVSKQSWQSYHLSLIEQYYRKAKNFNNFFPGIMSLYQELETNPSSNLSENNERIIQFFMELYNINVPLVRTSSLDVATTKSQRLVDICKALYADTYLSGMGAKAYLDEQLFDHTGIQVKWQEFHYVPYFQVNSPTSFVPNMCIIDALLNRGNKLPTLEDS